MDRSYDEMRFHTIEENLKNVRERIAEAAVKSGRVPENVRLMAVSKTVEPKYIQKAISCGVDLIGENKVQELLAKKPELKLDGVEAQLIGHLQTNKVRQIVGEVSMIQSVDSLRLAEEIGRQSLKRGITTKVLIEVNIGMEENKSGVRPSQLQEILCEIAAVEGVSVQGLMAIPPICEKSEQSRTFFSKMTQLFVDIRCKKLDNISMSVLSMGMSGDYREAILEGSNLVRVGTSIFGDRIY